MNTNWPGSLTIILFVLITILGFFTWIGLLFALWLALQAAGAGPDLWAMTEALSTAVAAAAVLSAGFVAYRELSDRRYCATLDRKPILVDKYRQYRLEGTLGYLPPGILITNSR